MLIFSFFLHGVWADMCIVFDQSLSAFFAGFSVGVQKGRVEVSDGQFEGLDLDVLNCSCASTVLKHG